MATTANPPVCGYHVAEIALWCSCTVSPAARLPAHSANATDRGARGEPAPARLPPDGRITNCESTSATPDPWLLIVTLSVNGAPCGTWVGDVGVSFTRMSPAAAPATAVETPVPAVTRSRHGRTDHTSRRIPLARCTFPPCRVGFAWSR